MLRFCKIIFRDWELLADTKSPNPAIPLAVHLVQCLNTYISISQIHTGTVELVAVFPEFHLLVSVVVLEVISTLFITELLRYHSEPDSAIKDFNDD